LGPGELAETAEWEEEDSVEDDRAQTGRSDQEEPAPARADRLAEYILAVRAHCGTDQKVAAEIQRVLERIGFSAEVLPLEPEAFRLAQRDSLYDFLLDVAVPHFTDAALSYQAFLANHNARSRTPIRSEPDLREALGEIAERQEWIPLLHLNAYFVTGTRATGIESLPTGGLWIADAWVRRTE
jgi:hypothetical protein